MKTHAKALSLRTGLPLLGLVAAVAVGFQSSLRLFSLALVSWAFLFFIAYKHPKPLLLGYIGLLPFLPSWFGTVMYGLGAVTATRALGSAVLLGILASHTSEARGQLMSSRASWIILLRMFLLGLWPLLLLHATLSNSIRTMAWFALEAFLPFLLVMSFAREEEWLRRLLLVLFVSASIVGALAVYESVTSVNVFDSLIPLQLRLPDAPEVMRLERFGFIRVEGAFRIEILLGWYSGLMLILYLAGASLTTIQGSPIIRVVMTLFIAAGLVVSFSGTPFISTLIGLGVLVVLWPRLLTDSRLLWLLIIGGLMFLAAEPFMTRVLQAIGAYFQIGASTYTEPIRANTEGRLRVYQLLSSFVTASPIHGYGSLDASAALSVARDISSRYLTELLEGGILWLTTLLLPIGIAVMNAMKAWRTNTNNLPVRRLSAGLLAAFAQVLAMFVVMSTALMVETFIWILVGLAVALPSLRNCQKAQ